MSSPAGWHPDPLGRHEHRYWDGTRWTEHVADGGRSGHDPIEASPPDTSGDASQPTTATEAAGGEPASQTPTPAAATPTAAADTPTTPEETAATAPAGPAPSGQASPQAQAPPHQPFAQGATQPGGSTGQAQVPPQQSFPQAGGPSGQPPATNGVAVAAMIIGILSLLVAWIPFVGLLGVVGGFLAVVLGLIGRGRAKRVANGGALAITGLVTGALAVLVGIASTVLPVLFFQGMIGDFEAVDRCIEQTGDEQACIEEHAPGWVRFLDGLED